MNRICSAIVHLKAAFENAGIEDITIILTKQDLAKLVMLTEQYTGVHQDPESVHEFEIAGVPIQRWYEDE